MTRRGRPASAIYPAVVQMGGRRWFQVLEAARRLKVSRGRVYQIIAAGRVRVHQWHQLYYVDEPSLNRYRTVRDQILRARGIMI